MKLNLRNPVWVGALVVLVLVLALAANLVLAGAHKAPADQTRGAMTQASQSQHGCSMMGGSSPEDCPMMKNGAMHAGSGYAILKGKVSLTGRDGSITVRVKPGKDTPDTTKKALAKLKAGDEVSVVMMLGKPASGTQTTTTAKPAVAKYVCPMHPEVTSDKPGRCPKCGMNLTLVK